MSNDEGGSVDAYQLGRKQIGVLLEMVREDTNLVTAMDYATGLLMGIADYVCTQSGPQQCFNMFDEVSEHSIQPMLRGNTNVKSDVDNAIDSLIAHLRRQCGNGGKPQRR